MNRLRVGMIGLGEVAQIVHLPILEALSDRYQVSAVCDISPSLVAHVAERYSVPGRYADVHEMLANEQLDCVFVLNSDEYHADCVVAALDHGVHVLVEKPMCLSPRELDEIVAARDRSGKVVMVAYMRRFAPAFDEAVKRLPELGPISYARVRDIIGQNRLIIDQTSVVFRPDDLPAGAMEDRWARGSALVREALGEVPEELAWTYRLLCGLGSHDLSAMRELLGSPRSVISARQWRRAGWIVALLDYGDFVVTYETGVDDQLRFDAHIEVFGQTGSLRLQYDTPYVRHFPTTLVSDRTAGDSYERSVYRPHLKDPYTCELEYFHEVVTSGATPKTTPEDYRHDMELFIELIRAMQRPDPSGGARPST